MCTFCSPSHAQTGESNWMEKKRLDIRMGVPLAEELPVAEGDNLIDLE